MPGGARWFRPDTWNRVWPHCPALPCTVLYLFITSSQLKTPEQKTVWNFQSVLSLGRQHSRDRDWCVGAVWSLKSEVWTIKQLAIKSLRLVVVKAVTRPSVYLTLSCQPASIRRLMLIINANMSLSNLICYISCTLSLSPHQTDHHHWSSPCGLYYMSGSLHLFVQC